MLWTALGSATATFAICAAGDSLGRRLGVLDVPDGRRKRHPRPTPLVGGLAAGIPVFVVLAVLLATSPLAPLMAGVAATLVAFLTLGFVDDRRELAPAVRLAVSTALALIVVLVVPEARIVFVQLTFLDGPWFLGTIGGLAFSVLCLIGLQNAVNMADGRNGLAPGLLLIWTLLLLAHVPAPLQLALTALAAALAVAFGFSLAGRVFLGDSGAYGLSVAVGLLAILAYSLEFPALPADVVALWFLLPVADALRVIVLRALAGRSPFSAGEDHLHNLLERLVTWRWGLVVYLALVAVPGLVAIGAPESAPALAAATLAAYAALVVASRWAPSARRLRLPRG